ncbi:MAG: hypothetical protein MPW14_18455 [Candidatus Manganitrophus sp.]|nr:hypothetical protein [Candidatus Manganitrophus sp.]WDT79113.1 MAG: hypothetical protein MPW14_18455 [Candidatus Manganitrophus sp.]
MRRIFLLVFIIALSGCSALRSAKLFAPTWFGFVQIADGVYVDDAMHASQQEELLKTIAVAKGRVSDFFGHLEGDPTIFACSTEACFAASGGFTAKGTAYGSSRVLLSPRGLGLVTISHELTHVELYSRVGDFRAWHAIPPWFDEGLAVLVSQDPDYTIDTWLRATDNGRGAPALKLLGNAVPWAEGQLSYGTARHVVGEWYSRVGSEGFFRLLRGIKAGRDFDFLFGRTPFIPGLADPLPHAGGPPGAS